MAWRCLRSSSRYADSNSGEYQHLCRCQNRCRIGYGWNYRTHSIHLWNRFVVHMGVTHIHSQLCSLHWIVDCDSASIASWVCDALAWCLVHHVDSSRFQSTTLGKYHRDEVGWSSTGHLTRSSPSHNSLLLLGMGHLGHGSCRSVHGHFQDCSRKH